MVFSIASALPQAAPGAAGGQVGGRPDLAGDQGVIPVQDVQDGAAAGDDGGAQIAQVLGTLYLTTSNVQSIAWPAFAAYAHLTKRSPAYSGCVWRVATFGSGPTRPPPSPARWPGGVREFQSAP